MTRNHSPEAEGPLSPDQEETVSADIIAEEHLNGGNTYQANEIAVAMRSLYRDLANEFLCAVVRPEDITVKKDGSRQTTYDVDFERRIEAAIRSVDADYGFLGEEWASEEGRAPGEFEALLEKEILFITDPIDGTHAFIKRKPYFSSTVGVLRRDSATGRFSPLAGYTLLPHRGLYLEANTEGATYRKAETMDDLARISVPGDLPRHIVIALHPRLLPSVAPHLDNRKEITLTPLTPSVHAMSDVILNRLHASWIQASLWDIAGPLAIGAPLGYRLYDMRTKVPLMSVGKEDLTWNAQDPWRLKNQYIFCHEAHKDEIFRHLLKIGVC